MFGSWGVPVQLDKGICSVTGFGERREQVEIVIPKKYLAYHTAFCPSISPSLTMRCPKRQLAVFRFHLWSIENAVVVGSSVKASKSPGRCEIPSGNIFSFPSFPSPTPPASMVRRKVKPVACAGHSLGECAKGGCHGAGTKPVVFHQRRRKKRVIQIVSRLYQGGTWTFILKPYYSLSLSLSTYIYIYISWWVSQ